ncbi:type II toxin-antitoxin system YoeB family toxin [Hymenobacter canadensis]|uniref:Type II toxin-antitoxin system YoeB family toxin n=1 Tax=Hymenobacter canadensis TaxID=2999067 RepID=A0ABY7LU49_9BACT|nr:type II toxin-antitoxin system YoeB family toxin [Hymenobacter canadensis]WBA43933.1 type II toxin-antitoxin system YoeB family toxin [Hymenobacter canadensis]
MEAIYLTSLPSFQLRPRFRGGSKKCLRTSTTSTGKPEPLKHGFAGFWSRRISGEHWLIYRFEADLV